MRHEAKEQSNNGMELTSLCFVKNVIFWVVKQYIYGLSFSIYHIGSPFDIYVSENQ